MEAELTELLDLNQKQIAAMEQITAHDNSSDAEDIYCSVNEIQERIKVPVVPSVVDKRDVLQEISLNKVSIYCLIDVSRGRGNVANASQYNF